MICSNYINSVFSLEIKDGLFDLISFILTRLGEFSIWRAAHFVFKASKNCFNAIALLPVFQNTELRSINLFWKRLEIIVTKIKKFRVKLDFLKQKQLKYSHFSIRTDNGQIDFIIESDFRSDFRVVRSASNFQRVNSVIMNSLEKK